MAASTLEMALGYEHARIRELAEPAHHPAAAHPERRHQTDWFYAIAAQHLAAAEDVLLPRVRELPDGAAMVVRYVGNAKELERSLRFLKGRQYGDSRFLHLHHEDLWQHIDRLLTEHEAMEASCSRQLCEHLDDSRVNALTEDLLEAEEVAPTRAHPSSPHTGRVGRIAHRMWRMADSAWDSAEGRVVPIKYHAHPKRDSALSHYLYGTPMPREEEPH
ncbi:hypothetical protein [Kribbella solani]|uniref:Hemerythrin domain-containing protein n=1 Tax=Kribbella solani TaxID=236067 RepID=A0A841DPP0_9ACTN|nr:hypothetical protein [Kribbella solani]MBB5981094.1 hypothetical protein [Kribbella solani]MDX2970441.1 hypothetical protein [Kribbella solani]MDX3003667.1 hypothetical protein [Kribbella solani]